MSSLYEDLEITKYPFIGYAPNLIDYFLIIGYDHLFIENDLKKQMEMTSKLENKAEKSDTKYEYQPKTYPTILSSIPSFQSHNKLMIENDIILKLIFPEPPFVFYNKNTKKQKGYNVNFGSFGDTTGNNDSCSNKTIYNGYAYIFYEEHALLDSNFSAFIPKAFCIISQYPYFYVFSKICKDIQTLFEKSIKDKVEIPIEILLFNLINFTPSPLTTGIRLTTFPNCVPSYYGSKKEQEDKEQEKEKIEECYRNELSQDPLEEESFPFKAIYIEQLKGYPIIDFHLSEILSIFTTSKLIQLAVFSFLEIDFVFFSDNLETLNLIMYMISTFSYPCMDSTYLWHILSVPKKDLNVESKNPFVGKTFTSMLGVNCIYDEEVYSEFSSMYKIVFIVDINKKQIILKYEEDDDEAAKTAKEIQKLRTFIDRICDDRKYKSKYLEKAIRTLSDRLNQASRKVGNFQVVNYTKKINFYSTNKPINRILNAYIQEAFYDFVLNILKEFYSFYKLCSKEQDEDLSMTFMSHSDMDLSSQNLSIISQDNVSKNDISMAENEGGDIEIDCKEMDEKMDKEKTHYLFHYKESIKEYCEEERIFFNLFHESSKFVPFIREFIPNHKAVDLYKIPLIFSEEFILVKRTSNNHFDSHYFEVIDNFYSSELKQIVSKIKKVTLKTKISESLIQDTESMYKWKADNYENFFLAERGKRIINFNAFYSFYEKELKNIFSKLKRIKKVRQTQRGLETNYPYPYFELENQIINVYANYIFSLDPEDLKKIFPSQEVILNNEIPHVRMRKITNSIEKILVLFKSISTDILLLYCFLLVLCVSTEVLDDNDINNLLKSLPNELFCIRKYFTMLISVLYRQAKNKWDESKSEDSIKEVIRHLKWCKQITSFLNKKQILPNHQLSQLLECLFVLEQSVKDKSNSSFSALNQNNISISSDTTTCKVSKDDESDDKTQVESEGGKKVIKNLPLNEIIGAKSEYEFELIYNEHNGDHSKDLEQNITIDDILRLSANLEFDGSFLVNQLKEDEDNLLEKIYIKLNIKNVDKEFEKVEIFSPLKLYNNCSSIVASFYKELSKEKLQNATLNVIVTNLMFYFENYESFKNKWYSKFLLKYYTQSKDIIN